MFSSTLKKFLGTFSVLVCFSEAKLSFSNIQGQKDFLNALLAEVEKSKETDDEGKNDIDKYKEDITTLQKTLFSIEDESAREGADKKILQELVDAYNKKMKELEKMYRNIMKKKKSNANDEYLNARSHDFEETCADSLNYGNKRRKIKEAAFQPLELVEVKASSSGEDLPINRIANKAEVEM